MEKKAVDMHPNSGFRTEAGNISSKLLRYHTTLSPYTNLQIICIYIYEESAEGLPCHQRSASQTPCTWFRAQGYGLGFRL